MLNNEYFHGFRKISYLLVVARTKQYKRRSRDRTVFQILSMRQKSKVIFVSYSF